MGIGRRGSTCDGKVSAIGALGAALGDERGESVGDGGRTHLHGGPYGFEGERRRRLCQGGLDTVDGAGGGGIARIGGHGILYGQREAVALSEQVKREAVGRSGGTMLDGEAEFVPVAGPTQVEVAVAPGVQLGAA